MDDPRCLPQLARGGAAALLAGFVGLSYAQAPGHQPTAVVRANAGYSGHPGGRHSTATPGHSGAQASGRIASLLVKSRRQRCAPGNCWPRSTTASPSQGSNGHRRRCSKPRPNLMPRRSLIAHATCRARGLLASRHSTPLRPSIRRPGGTGKPPPWSRSPELAQSFAKVTAPFDGWVQQTLADTGDLAVPGKPLAVVYAPQPLRAVVQVPASRSEALLSAGIFGSGGWPSGRGAYLANPWRAR